MFIKFKGIRKSNSKQVSWHNLLNSCYGRGQWRSGWRSIEDYFFGFIKIDNYTVISGPLNNVGKFNRNINISFFRNKQTSCQDPFVQDQEQDQDLGVPKPRLRLGSPKTVATNSVTDIWRNNQFYCSLFSTHLMEMCKWRCNYTYHHSTHNIDQ